LRVAVEANGELRGVRTANLTLPADLGEAIDWTLSGSADPALDSLELDRVAVSGGGFEIDGKGTARAQLAALDATATIGIADLSRLAALAGHPARAGRARLGVALSRRGGDAPALLRWNGALDDMRTGFAAADALLGRHVEIASRARREADGSTALEELALA